VAASEAIVVADVLALTASERATWADCTAAEAVSNPSAAAMDAINAATATAALVCRTVFSSLSLVA
jgi:hypothetical protein